MGELMRIGPEEPSVTDSSSVGDNKNLPAAVFCCLRSVPRGKRRQQKSSRLPLTIFQFHVLESTIRTPSSYYVVRYPYNIFDYVLLDYLD